MSNAKVIRIDRITWFLILSPGIVGAFFYIDSTFDSKYNTVKITPYHTNHTNITRN